MLASRRSLSGACFAAAREKVGPLLFGTQLMFIRRLTRRTGPRGISMQALEAWDLNDTANLPRSQRGRLVGANSSG